MKDLKIEIIAIIIFILFIFGSAIGIVTYSASSPAVDDECVEVMAASGYLSVSDVISICTGNDEEMKVKGAAIMKALDASIVCDMEAGELNEPNTHCNEYLKGALKDIANWG